MPSPVYLDGPLEGRSHPVPDSTVEQGMYRFDPDTVYTFTLVQVFEHRIVVASVANGIPSPDMLFRRLMTPDAQAAAG